MSKNRASSVKAVQRESAEELSEMTNAALTRSKEADGTGPTEVLLSVRARVLEAACELFAVSGFHGTHLREICKRAGTNVAGVCYYFQSKEGLYEAVIMEAGRQLSDDNGTFAACRHLPSEERLLKVIESLLKKLGAKRAWIAKLLSRELVDTVGGVNTYAAFGAERDFVQLQAVMKDLPDPKADGENTQLQALSIIGECVFYSLKAENPRHAFPSSMCLPSRAHVAQFLTRRSLGALRGKEIKPEEPGQ